MSMKSVCLSDLRPPNLISESTAVVSYFLSEMSAVCLLLTRKK